MIFEIISFVLSFSLIYLLVYFLLTLYGNFGKLQKIPKIKNLPSVSLLIPAYNEEETITKTIKSCLNLNYPKNKLEIIVINDGSIDETREICEEFGKKIVLINKKRGGKASALNIGIGRAKGSIIGTLDADSFYEDKNFLLNMVPFFKDKTVGSVTPIVKIFKPPKLNLFSNLLQSLQYFEYIFAHFIAKIQSFVDCIYVTPGPGSLYRKNMLLEVGKFDENSLTEDMEIGFRLQKHNYRIEKSLDAHVFTYAPKNILSLFKQRLRWNAGFIENSLKHPELFSMKYGDLGIMLLPLIFITVIFSFFFVYLVLIKPATEFVNDNYMYLVDWGLLFPLKINIPTFSNFLMNIDTTSLTIMFSLLSLNLVLFLLGMHIISGISNLKATVPQMFIFMFFYPILIAIFSMSACIYFIKYRIRSDKFEVWKT